MAADCLRMDFPSAFLSMKRLIAMALALVAAGCAPLARVVSERGVRERVGVLANLDIGWERSTGPLLRALAYFREQGVDKVVVLGDPTKNGYPNQRAVFEAAWRKAFRGATPPERLLAPSELAFGGVTFTGEGRLPLTDLLCVHPRDGRRVNAGSMRGIAVSGVFDRQDRATVAGIASSAQGLLVLVRDDGMEIRRLDFSSRVAEEVGPPWRVDRAGRLSSEGDAVPQFWADTRIDVTPGYDAKGRAVYTVRWPPVLARHTGARAFSYDVSKGDKVVRRVQSAGFFLPESRDGAAVTCVIPVADVEGVEGRFGVTPLSSLGRRGATVWQ